jgi:hypothetical protein
MSNINVIGVIGALLIAGAFLTHHMVQAISRRNTEITTGVAQGVPIPWETRWRMITNVQVPVVGFSGALQLILAFAFRTIGDSADHAEVELLAQACAWMYFCLGCLTLILAPLGLAAAWRAAKSYPEGCPLANR